jgi:hypothetical protein
LNISAEFFYHNNVDVLGSLECVMFGATLGEFLLGSGRSCLSNLAGLLLLLEQVGTLLALLLQPVGLCSGLVELSLEVGHSLIGICTVMSSSKGERQDPMSSAISFMKIDSLMPR